MSQALKKAQTKYAATTRRDNFKSMQVPTFLHAELKSIANNLNSSMIDVLKLLINSYKDISCK